MFEKALQWRYKLLSSLHKLNKLVQPQLVRVCFYSQLKGKCFRLPLVRPLLVSLLVMLRFLLFLLRLLLRLLVRLLVMLRFLLFLLRLLLRLLVRLLVKLLLLVQ